MKIKNWIQWAATWAGMSLLKKGLHHRLEGTGSEWLQDVPSNVPAIFNRVDFILDQCRNKRVLHIGFTDHPYTIIRAQLGKLLHLQLKKVTDKLIGLDIAVDAINQYVAITNDQAVCAGDIMQFYPKAVIDFEPEIILLSEVLEHLTDPYKAVQVLHDHFPEGTTVLVTVPNYAALDTMSSSLQKTESVHPHHHWYFSPFTLQKLFDDKKFKLQQLHFGMYYQPRTRINAILKHFPFNGDCIMALFTIIKTNEHG